ncbi:uncharacterized protein [Palaemon carinicauda]|uniref:uncharacterized protein n=1 Tax=Palaemon carinicauda TaxID=392227 RepID=UPI0035B646A6
MGNPADKITRCLSFKSLMKSNYHKGPNIRDLDLASKSDILGFKLPIVENLETIEACSASTSIKESKTLNLYPDTHNLIRVICKFNEKCSVTNQTYPILLSRESTLTKLIILDEHLLLKHAGCYALLTELRRKFWIPKFFSTVKRILKECVVCRRYNQRPVKLNQSAYREFRLSPSDKPFGNVYLDYCGPFYVRQGRDKVKVWILVISCMFTRAVNLKICMDMTVEEFLRALSLHSFEYGVPQFIVSDLGTQIVAGANIVQDFLKDAETVQCLTDDNVERVHFQQDFEYLVCHAVHLINRRPIAFKEALRDCSNNVPTPITPEELIHGYSLVSLNIIPALQADPDSDEDFQVYFDVVHKIKTSYEKLKQIRTNLLEIYHREFMNTLIKQATDKKDRYAPVNHKQISIGDIVLIKEDGYKPVN